LVDLVAGKSQIFDGLGKQPFIIFAKRTKLIFIGFRVEAQKPWKF
jgi:hypothetical protein